MAELIRQADAAAYLGIHPNTLRKWSRQGKAPRPIASGIYSRRQIELLAAGKWSPPIEHEAVDIWREALE